MSGTTCLLCRAGAVAEILQLPGMPALVNRLARTESEARGAPCGDIALVGCGRCGLVFNRAHEAALADYVPDYENALHHSPSFRTFAEDLVAGLVARHPLEGATVVEIGCGDGYLLDLLVRHGVGRAIGYDPSMADRTTAFSAAAGVEIVPAYFAPGAVPEAFDFVVCRHVLEHLSDPLAFMRGLRAAIDDPRIGIYFEVPNAEWIFRNVSLWDVIFEHVTYWSESSLVTLFHRAGFEPTQVRRVYGGQFLSVEARPADPEPDFLSLGAGLVREEAVAFGRAAAARLAVWRHRLGASPRRAVLWGAGSKGITFANALGAGDDGLVALVDLNPRKQGMVAPGVGLPVVPPDALGEIAPDLVLIANPLYENEIRGSCRALGIDPEIAVIGE